nr:MAG: hypothetical protein [Chemarfal virus 170]
MVSWGWAINLARCWDESDYGFGLVECLSLWIEHLKFKWWLSARKRQQRREASRRAMRAIRHLHCSDLNDMEVDLASHGIKKAYMVSRVARRELKSPKYSLANEMCVADYLNKNKPEGMRSVDWLAIQPLAIKLTFVRDINEATADCVFSRLRALVDTV